MHGVSDSTIPLVTGNKNTARLRQLIRLPHYVLTLNGAKVLLFFDMCKFFGKKMQEKCVFSMSFAI